jgi:hypothetical protein
MRFLFEEHSLRWENLRDGYAIEEPSDNFWENGRKRSSESRSQFIQKNFPIFIKEVVHIIT